MCEQGEVDLVEALSQPFPLLVICDMMGIPRSEFGTVLDATNVILGAGDPDMLGGRDPMTAMFEAGMQLTDADERARRGAPQEPAPTTSPPRSCTPTSTRTSWRRTRSRRSSSCSRSPATTRPAPRSAAACTCCRRIPINAGVWQDDLDGVTTTAVEEIVRVRVAGHVHAAHRDEDATRVGDHDFAEGDKVVLFYGVANRDPRVFDDPERFDVLARPQPARRLRRAGPALLPRRAPRPPRGRGRVPPAAHPPARHRGRRRRRCRSRRWASRWSAASSTCPSASRRPRVVNRS